MLKFNFIVFVLIIFLFINCSSTAVIEDDSFLKVKPLPPTKVLNLEETVFENEDLIINSERSKTSSFYRYLNIKNKISTELEIINEKSTFIDENSISHPLKINQDKITIVPPESSVKTNIDIEDYWEGKSKDLSFFFFY